MANPTTYFGWVMPTSSSLVTNLPADFNTFGQGVDTSLQDLLGGTTGQVLSKTSGTNMDFTWVTPTDQTPLTTKGDLFTFSTVDARLGVGTNGQTLVADSAEATGLKWATPTSAGGMTLITTSTLSNVASASLNDVFTSTYTNYRIVWNLTGTTTVSDFTMRFRVSGTDNSSSNYRWSGQYNTSGVNTITGEYSNGTQTSIDMAFSRATGQNSTVMDVFSPQTTSYTTFSSLVMANRPGDSVTQFITRGGGLSVDTSYTGFTVIGTANFGGTISVYGYGK